MCSSIFGRQRSVIPSLAFVAGIRVGWNSTRKVAEGQVACDLFTFLTTERNVKVGAVHPKAMPVILTETKDVETWPGSLWYEESRLKRPQQNGTIRTAARGEKFDENLDEIPVVCATATQS